MVSLRSLGSMLRGRSTRLQVMLACVLGGLLGFVPGFFLFEDLAGGFAQAPGLILLFLSIALIANANLVLFAMATVLAKLLSIALLSVSFALGTWLVDGPLQGLLRWLCNSQYSAWFGLEYYATTGSLVLGLAFGLLFAWACNRALRAVRRHMANVERSSDRYREIEAKWWVRLLSWPFLGRGKRRRSWQEVAEQPAFGMPIRILGVIAVVVLVGSVFTFQQWFSTPLLTKGLQSSLAAGNGATVDLEEASLHLGEGVIRIKKLAMADRGELGKDLFAADELVLTIDTTELLRRRFVIDEIKAVGARAGTRRDTPGVLLPPAEPEPEPPPTKELTIEDYLEQYELWRQRLDQAKGWVETVFAEGDEGGVPATPEQEQAERQRQIEVLGMAGVLARHLFTEGPRVLIRKVDIEGITWTNDGAEEQLSLRLRNISTAPSLYAEPPSVALANATETFAVGFQGGDGAGVGLSLMCKDLPVDRLFSGLRISGERPVSGGTFDFDCRGALSWTEGAAMTLDLPLAVTLRGTTLAIPGAGATKLDELALPFGLSGSVVRPSVHLEAGALRDALLAAGKQELAQLVQARAGALLEGVSDKLPSELQGIVDPNKKPEEMVDDLKKKAEEAAKKQLEEEKAKALKSLEKKLPGIGGLFGNKKKK